MTRSCMYAPYVYTCRMRVRHHVCIGNRYGPCRERLWQRDWCRRITHQDLSGLRLIAAFNRNSCAPRERVEHRSGRTGKKAYLSKGPSKLFCALRARICRRMRKRRGHQEKRRSTTSSHFFPVIELKSYYASEVSMRDVGEKENIYFPNEMSRVTWGFTWERS